MATLQLLLRHPRNAWYAAGLGVILLGVVGLLVLSPWSGEAGEPSALPSPSATLRPSPSATLRPSQSATPRPTPTPSAAAALTPGPIESPRIIGTVTHHLNLPPAQPLEAGLLASAGAGWSLVLYSASTIVNPPVTGPLILYLVSPDGDVYQAYDFGVGVGDDLQETSVALVDWAPESSRALILTGAREGWGDYSTVQVLDLETGDVVGGVTVDPGLRIVRASFTQPTGRNLVVMARTSDGGWLKRFSSDGRELATVLSGADSPGGEFWPRWLYSQDGTSLLVSDQQGEMSRVSVDGATVTPVPLPPGTFSCWLDRRWEDGRMLAACREDFGPDPASPTGSRLAAANMWLISMTDQAPVRLTSHVPTTIVDFGIYACWEEAGTLYAVHKGECSNVSFGSLPAADGTRTGGVGGVLVVGHRGETFVGIRFMGCGSPNGDLVLVDVADWSVRVVVPRLGDAEGVRDVVTR